MTDARQSAAGRLIDLPTVPGPKGNLTFLESERHVPFAVRRAYYIYDVPPGEQRGGLAHRDVDLCMIAVAGSVEVRLDDGTDRVRHLLDRPDIGLLVPRMLWLEMAGWAPATVCLVLSSELYDEADYVRDYDQFRQLAATAARLRP